MTEFGKIFLSGRGEFQKKFENNVKGKRYLAKKWLLYKNIYNSKTSKVIMRLIINILTYSSDYWEKARWRETSME
ncbi:hypothetical protein BDFB_004547 [Asbolus verrucosus]|uniref:Uncharacterized protein n=1 Tax=Asbolus verrucosus TaxID=1661398 RepID=A0A482WC10_ASBVE|nr:hypothetical protein BDFB_004547 [Asbolus verrucosus]